MESLKNLNRLEPLDFGVVGRYIFTLKFYPSWRFASWAGNEIQLTDGIEDDFGSRVKLTNLRVRYDCGSKLGFLKPTLITLLSIQL